MKQSQRKQREIRENQKRRHDAKVRKAIKAEHEATMENIRQEEVCSSLVTIANDPSSVTSQRGDIPGLVNLDDAQHAAWASDR